MFLRVLMENGAVTSLYAEAHKPSFCGTASGVVVTSGCPAKAISLFDRNVLSQHKKYYHLFSQQNVLFWSW